MNQEKQKLLARLPKVLLPWYETSARPLPWRETKDPYRVWLSEIMLQQTRVEAVKQYYTRFLEALPTIEALAAAEESLLLKLWEGLGYYSRARNLQKAAQRIMNEHGGVFPTQYKDILALPGIGAYTAGAVSSICFDRPTPAVDGNVLRVVSRITELFEPVSTPAVKKDITESLAEIYPKTRCGDFTQSLMELGATVCVPNGAPACGICPAARFCLAHKNNTESRLPLRPEKKARKCENRTVFLLLCGEHIAILKRPETGLLAGLWEFPNVLGALSKEKAVTALKQWDIVPSGILQSVSRKHIFTHVEWNMTGYYFTCDRMPDTLTWVTLRELETEIALPTAFKQFCALLP